MDGLKLISLNTGFCESTNFFLYINQSDPDATMTWLVSELVEVNTALLFLQRRESSQKRRERRFT